MSQLNKDYNKNLPEYVYFDINVANKRQTTQQSEPFSYNEIRSSPFLDGPSGSYKMSIIRFSVDTDSPVFIPQIQSNQTDINLTEYTITMTGPNAVASVNVKWIPQFPKAARPPPPSSTSTGEPLYTTGYYDCKSYSWFMLLLNIASKECMVQLQTADGDPVDTSKAPLFVWDESRDCMNILFEDEFKSSLSTTSPIVVVDPTYKLFFNVQLFQLFNTLPAEFLGYDGSVPAGQNYYIPCYDSIENRVEVDDAQGNQSHTEYRITQEASTAALISPFTALVFTSNALPIVSTQVSAPISYQDGQIIQSGSGDTTSNIISDIKTDDNVYGPSLLYEPRSQFRYISMVGNEKLSRLDLQVFLRLRNGSLYPVRMASGSNLTCKILFKKKELNE